MAYVSQETRIRDGRVRRKRNRFGNLVRPRLVEEQGGRCFYCLHSLSYMTAVLEHKTPLSRGGHDTFSNLVAACQACDKEKGTMTAEEYLRLKWGDGLVLLLPQ